MKLHKALCIGLACTLVLSFASPAFASEDIGDTNTNTPTGTENTSGPDTDNSTPPDNNTPDIDTGNPPDASEPSKPDTPTPPDSGTTEPDTPAPPDTDTSEPDTPTPPDSGTTEPDTPAPPDSGTTEPDTPAPPDSGTTEPDTPAPPDSGATEPDTPTPPDSGATEPDTPVPPDSDMPEPETPKEPVTPELPPEEIEPPAEEPPIEEEPVLPVEESPMIRVSVPSSATVLVNPYRLQCPDGNGGTTREQIINTAQFIQSESNVPLSVNISATGTVPDSSEVIFSQEPPEQYEEAKLVFLYLDIQLAENSSGSPVEPDWLGEYRPKETLLVTEHENFLENVLILPAAVFEEDGQTVSQASYAALKLFGAASTRPITPWDANDIINVSITFSFIPMV